MVCFEKVFCFIFVIHLRRKKIARGTTVQHAHALFAQCSVKVAQSYTLRQINLRLYSQTLVTSALNYLSNAEIGLNLDGSRGLFRVHIPERIS